MEGLIFLIKWVLFPSVRRREREEQERWDAGAEERQAALEALDQNVEQAEKALEQEDLAKAETALRRGRLVLNDAEEKAS